MKLGFTYVTTPSRVVDHSVHCFFCAGIEQDRWVDVADTYQQLSSPHSYSVEQVCNITPEEFTKLIKNPPFCEQLDEGEIYFIAEDESEKETLHLIKSRKNRERLLATL